MTIPLLLPELDAGDETIRVSAWLVDPGDEVSEGDRVVEVLIRGMTFDVAAPDAGVLRRISKPYDAVVAPGEVLAWIEPGDRDREKPE